MIPDPKAQRRVINPDAMKAAVLREPACVICGKPSATAHHIVKRGQRGDDVPENLVGVCGSGTTGCHGVLENEDDDARLALGWYIATQRPDIWGYLVRKKGGREAASQWLEHRLLIHVV